MPDYSKCLIYKLCCKNLYIKDFYIGSTCNFRKRKHQHKFDCGNKNIKVYKFIRDTGGWENWDMILVEEYPCENKLQKEKRERYWIDELKPNLNTYLPVRVKVNFKSHIPGVTEEEFYKLNQEYKKKQQDIKRKNNSEKLKEKEEKQKEKSEKLKEKITCECGCVINRASMYSHIKDSVKHKKRMAAVSN